MDLRVRGPYLPSRSLPLYVSQEPLWNSQPTLYTSNHDKCNNFDNHVAAAVPRRRLSGNQTSLGSIRVNMYVHDDTLYPCDQF
jgi:hypothetical protein